MFEGLFRSESKPVSKTIEMIEKLLREWKIDPHTVKNPQANFWSLVQGSANFHIQLFQYNKGEQKVECIEVGGNIMKLPEENFLPLYRKLLDLNSTSVGVYFAIRDQFVMLLSTRDLEGLDYIEFKTMVDDVRYYSDYWDDILMKEFQGHK